MVDKPNFLIFLPDQHRGDWLPYDNGIFEQKGMKKLPLKMPNLKELMEKGITFTNAITPSPLCAPARACLASGKNYKDCGVKGNYQDYPVHQETYYSKLKNEGYITANVGKLDLHKPTLFWGLNGWIEDLRKLGFTEAIDNEGKWDAIFSVIREKDKNGRLRRVKPQNYTPKGPYLKFLADNNLLHIHINDFMKRFGKKNLNTEPTSLPDYAYCDNWIANNAIKMIREFNQDEPWHLVVNFTGPHDPWDITEKMKQKWENIKFSPPHMGNDETIQEEIKVRKNYAAMLENIDRNMGLIINEIKKRNQLDNTIIIYASDHGDMLGDFCNYGKMRPERGSVNIPMVISGPKIIEDIKSNALVELQDLNATILDYASIDHRNLSDSLSLRDILEGNKNNHRKYQISALDLREVGLGNWKLISDGEYKVILENNDKIRIYNIEEDPWETQNIVRKKPNIRKKFLNKLDSLY